MKRIFFLCLISLFSISVGHSQQSPSEAEKKRLQELNRSIDELDKQISGLKEKKGILEQERIDLLYLISQHASEDEFNNSPPALVTRVINSQQVAVIINKQPKEMWLHGIYVPMEKIAEAEAFIKKQIGDGLVYVRCANIVCTSGYIYLAKDKPSINTLLVQQSLARKTDEAKFDLAGFTSPPPKTENPTTVAPAESNTIYPKSTAGTDVQVRGYYRKDGTYVKPHTRSAPGKKKP